MTNSKNNILRNIFYAVGSVLGVIAVVMTINLTVRSEVNRITNNDEFLDELISKIQPYIIFDENESILIDRGGNKYIESIKIEKGIPKDMAGKDKPLLPFKVIITPKQLLSIAPLLQCIDEGAYSIKKVERGKGYTWIYYLQWENLVFPKRINKFRLDIIP